MESSFEITMNNYGVCQQSTKIKINILYIVENAIDALPQLKRRDRHHLKLTSPLLQRRIPFTPLRQNCGKRIFFAS